MPSLNDSYEANEKLKRDYHNFSRMIMWDYGGKYVYAGLITFVALGTIITISAIDSCVSNSQGPGQKIEKLENDLH